MEDSIITETGKWSEIDPRVTGLLYLTLGDNSPFLCVGGLGTENDQWLIVGSPPVGSIGSCH